LKCDNLITKINAKNHEINQVKLKCDSLISELHEKDKILNDLKENDVKLNTKLK